jgi:hypothetical protein
LDNPRKSFKKNEKARITNRLKITLKKEMDIKLQMVSKIIAVLYGLFMLSLALVSAEIPTITGKATQQPFNLSITISNTPPQIVRIATISDQSITENSYSDFLINFSARDNDGYANLNDTSVRVNVTRGAEPSKQNLTCSKTSSAGTETNYSCSIRIWYFDAAGDWNVSVNVSDLNNAVATNTSFFTLMQTSAFIAGPTALAFPSITPGSVNVTTTTGAIILNNTGNKAITAGNILINATNLRGESDPTRALYAGNFTIGTATGGSPAVECGAASSTFMTNMTFVGITSATLPKGNHSINNGTVGQEQLYLCLTSVGSELTSQVYSTAAEGSWTAKII